MVTFGSHMYEGKRKQKDMKQLVPINISKGHQILYGFVYMPTKFYQFLSLLVPPHKIKKPISL